LISMPDTAAMVAEIGVHETEVDKVRAGQAATIVMDAFPDQELKGEVLEVAPLPDQSRSFMSPDLKVYKTLVRIDGTHDFLRTRMSCKVTVLAEKIIEAVLVPIHVVANRQNQKVVYVPKGSDSEKRVVETGAFNDTFVEIKSGLEPGEKVLLNPPLFAEGTSSNEAFKDSDATGPAPSKQRRGGPQGAAGMNRQGAPGSGTKMSEAIERYKKMTPEQQKAAIAEAMKKRSGNASSTPGQMPGQGAAGGQGGPSGQRRPARGGSPSSSGGAPARN
jgi:hypothetical protein